MISLLISDIKCTLWMFSFYIFVAMWFALVMVWDVRNPTELINMYFEICNIVESIETLSNVDKLKRDTIPLVIYFSWNLQILLKFSSLCVLKIFHLKKHWAWYPFLKHNWDVFAFWFSNLSGEKKLCNIFRLCNFSVAHYIRMIFKPNFSTDVCIFLISMVRFKH